MPRRSTARVETLPAPILGWNTKDPISQMDPLYCVDTLNQFSDGSTVSLRNGHESWTTVGVGAGKIDSLYEFTRQNGTTELISWYSSGGGSWVSSIDTAGAATLRGGPVGGTDNAFWYCTFANNCFTGSYTGLLQPYVYAGGGPVAIAGFTGPASPASLVGGTVYKGRMYFYEYQTLTIWYAALGAVTGACTSFNLQTIFRKGGNISFVGSTTRFQQSDQVYFVIITNKGEVALYQGDYPGSATWALVGLYEMPPLISPRSWTYWGSNLVLMTVQGIVLLSEVISAGTSLTYLSDKINSGFKQYLDLSGTNYWRAQCIWSPQDNMLVFHLPSATGDYTEYQFVMNTTTQSWWKWATDVYDIGSIATFNGGMYFGYENRGIGKFAIGDYESTGREMMMSQAFSYFGDRAGAKQFTEMRPIMLARHEPYFSLGVSVDFDSAYPTTTWGEFLSSSVDTLVRPRVGLQGIGRCASVKFSGRMTDVSGGNARLSLQATDIIFNEGDIV